MVLCVPATGRLSVTRRDAIAGLGVIECCTKKEGETPDGVL